MGGCVQFKWVKPDRSLGNIRHRLTHVADRGIAVSETDIDGAEIAKWDHAVTEAVVGLLRPIVKRYFRSEVHGLDLLPRGGALVVSNHSGGQYAPLDWAIFAVDFYDKSGYDRPIYSLTHDLVFHGPTAQLLLHIGCIHATPDNAAKALRTGNLVLVFPGGDTTPTGRPCLRTSSTSAATLDTPGRPSTPGFRSFRRCPSAARRTRFTCLAAPGCCAHLG